MTTIYEAILNAEYNLTNNGSIGKMFAQDILVNVVAQIESGKELHDEMDEES